MSIYNKIFKDEMFKAFEKIIVKEKLSQDGQCFVSHSEDTIYFILDDYLICIKKGEYKRYETIINLDYIGNKNGAMYRILDIIKEYSTKFLYGYNIKEKMKKEECRLDYTINVDVVRGITHVMEEFYAIKDS